MKEIEIGNHRFLYEIKIHNSILEYSDYAWQTTEFYDGFKDKTYRKYGIFGQKLVKKVPVIAFICSFSIEAENLTNKQVNEGVMDQYNHWLELQERRENIKNGKLM